MSRRTSSATCAATIARPQVFRVRSAPDALSFNLGCTSVRLAPSAGRSPNNTAVTIVTAAANTSVRAFGATSSTIGPRPRDIMARSRSVTQYASATPAAPPAAARSALSVRSWRTIRPRAAPSESRTAISCCLALERTINRPARLAQATSSTTPTAAIRIRSGSENCAAELVQSLRAGIELERHGRTRRRRLSGGELRPSHAQRRPRLLARHARRESPDQVEPSSVRRHRHRLRGERRRDVDVASRLCPEELGRRDADDRERAPLHLEQRARRHSGRRRTAAANSDG